MNTLFLSDCSETWIFSTDFRKILKYQMHESPSSGRPLKFERADGRTDMTKVGFRNFANAPNNVSVHTAQYS